MKTLTEFKVWKKCIPLLPIFIASLSVLGTEKTAQAIVVAGDPDQYLVTPQDKEFTGVVSLNFFGEQGCTGSLVKGGRYILTAAHCVTIAFDVLGLNLSDIDVVFDLPKGQVLRNLSAAYIFPDWDINNIFQGGDIALLQLAQTAPKQATQYDIYREANEIGKTTTVVGYGKYGTGSTGEIDGSEGQKKIQGQNKLDALIEDIPTDFLPFPITPGSQLIVDFDNGLAVNDALSLLLGINDLGDNNEALPARGDSGSPSLINNRIAGVVSWGLGYPNLPIPPDIDDLTNTSFGEIAGYTRVSHYADWIDTTVNSTTIPEPGLDKGLLAIAALGIVSIFLGKSK